nr:unnamed protein product [Spirometra erinaceieuropaei]
MSGRKYLPDPVVLVENESEMWRNELAQRLDNLPIAAADDAAAAENATVENRWCQLRDTVQSTALAVLGRAPHQHQDWSDDNDAAIRNLLAEKNRLHKAYVDHPTEDNKAAFYRKRVFEETENVADCILAWPTRSQNMIFFEQREDHYGFIESPKNWLGETFADAHGYHSSESVLKMLENVDSAGAPEWHDFLYIRKPGEKTWTRRFCVIRNSGLYTTKKNKRAYTPTGLIRLLVFDENIHIYTTTGGWSRMRAPTPHGFALKTYAAQDFSSTHVFCFCASDEAALRQWVCRLRIAMLGRRLLSDYEEAMRRISSRVQADSQQTGYKTLTRKSPLECRRTSKHTGYSVSPQRMPKRQVSTGSLNSSPVIKMPMTQQMPHSQHHSFTGSLSPPLPRPVGHHLKNGGTVDCYQYQNLR